jgi:hypothetical protein
MEASSRRHHPKRSSVLVLVILVSVAGLWVCHPAVSATGSAGLAGRWTLAGARQPGSHALFDTRTTAYISFENDPQGTLVVSLVHSADEGCIEAAGYVTMTRNTLTLSKTIELTANGCSSTRVRAVTDLAKDLRRTVRMTRSKTRLEFVAMNGERYFFKRT